MDHRLRGGDGGGLVNVRCAVALLPLNRKFPGGPEPDARPDFPALNSFPTLLIVAVIYG